MLNKYIWVEQFRGQTLDEIILPPNLKRSLKKYVADGEIPHILLCSITPGSGKTSTAKALCNDLGADYSYLNASADGNIDTLRSKIIKFASCKGVFTNKPKIIILDEMDGTTPAFQSALRPVMEEFASNCRFIITCNYVHKIIEPIHSRCQKYDFNFTEKKVAEDLKKKIVKRVLTILKVNEVEYTSEDLIARFVDASFPDIRKTINSLQLYSDQNNKMIDEGIFNFESLDEGFYELLMKKDFQSCRKYVIESNIQPEDFFISLYKSYLPLLNNDEVRYAKSLIIINQYQFQNAFVVDKEINLAACILELTTV